MTTGRATYRSALVLGAVSLVSPGLWTVTQSAFAQAPAAPAALAEAAADAAAKAAFEAFPEADRKAIQDALVWTGDYAGIADGTFGRGTLAAIKAYQARTKAKPDGILAPAALTALKVEGAKVRQAAGFAPADDPKSGVRIGVPLKLLDQRSPGRSGTIFKAKDNSASLETFTEDPTKTTLAEMFQRLITDHARHVTYKVLRPDFFVVTLEASGKRFFTRVASGPAGIRGFTFIYPAQPGFDRYSVAIADSFAPFPDASKTGTATSEIAVTTPVKPGGPALAPRPIAQLSAIAVGPRQVLTAALPDGCTAPLVAGGPAKVLRSDTALGLALLERSGPEAQTPAISLRASEIKLSEAVVVLSATADGEANVSVATGEAPTASRILAPLQAPSGSPVFDRSGALAGLVTFQANIKRLPGGVVPAANYPIIGAEAIKRFLASLNQPLKAAEPGSTETSAGTVAAKYGRALTAVSCGS
ncbi:Putative peptidoglycan binding domain-containing protein [Rhizobiales bacterium GAS191]|nr:Putative peptidoglycan binding domain-containing protein [Rhizobiales bacterium GAS191]